VNNKSKKYEEVLCKDSQEELMDDDSGSLVFLILKGAESGQPSDGCGGWSLSQDLGNDSFL
jgi:hypothetical protein